MGLQESFRTYPKNLRVKILMILLNIHRAGVKHTDLKVRNIVLSRGSEKEPTIIDFNNASGHNCQFNGDIEDLEIGGWRPYFAIVECREIYYTCRAMDLWVPTETEHEGCTVPTECLSSAQELLGYMERYHGMSANLQENIRSAERCVAAFHIMYRNELRALGFLKT
ncbi:unnamed protein product [Somion occarium]|uniref:Protein kinase domain-containing protein n=1 Tax=Somion occarium TaxID=3059160 RepID=A0ABP1E5T1_9APHY